MSVDQNTVSRIARLARIAVPDDELPRLAGELSGILGWVEQLQEVDVTGIAPLTSVAAMQMKMREDVVTDGNIAATVTRNAPASEDHFYAVPKVVE